MNGQIQVQALEDLTQEGLCSPSEPQLPYFGNGNNHIDYLGLQCRMNETGMLITVSKSLAIRSTRWPQGWLA